MLPGPSAQERAVNYVIKFLIRFKVFSLSKPQCSHAKPRIQTPTRLPSPGHKNYNWLAVKEVKVSYYSQETL